MALIKIIKKRFSNDTEKKRTGQSGELGKVRNKQLHKDLMKMNLNSLKIKQNQKEHQQPNIVVTLCYEKVRQTSKHQKQNY
jgi:hypothetical protein